MTKLETTLIPLPQRALVGSISHPPEADLSEEFASFWLGAHETPPIATDPNTLLDMSEVNSSASIPRPSHTLEDTSDKITLSDIADEPSVKIALDGPDATQPRALEQPATQTIAFSNTVQPPSHKVPVLVRSVSSAILPNSVNTPTAQKSLPPVSSGLQSIPQTEQPTRLAASPVSTILQTEAATKLPNHATPSNASAVALLRNVVTQSETTTLAQPVAGLIDATYGPAVPSVVLTPSYVAQPVATETSPLSTAVPHTPTKIPFPPTVMSHMPASDQPEVVATLPDSNDPKLSISTVSAAVPNNAIHGSIPLHDTSETVTVLQASLRETPKPIDTAVKPTQTIGPLVPSSPLIQTQAESNLPKSAIIDHQPRNRSMPQTTTIQSPLLTQKPQQAAASHPAQMIAPAQVTQMPIMMGQGFLSEPSLTHGIETSDLHSRFQPSTPLQSTTVTPQAFRNQGPQVASQIAAAIVQTSGATTEITLNPKELGRVRIAMTPGDIGMSVTLLAERPETIELLRRNIEDLARELRDLGYENPTFKFGDQARDFDSDQDQPPTLNTQDDPILIAEDILQSTIRVALSGGLDLKL